MLRVERGDVAHQVSLIKERGTALPGFFGQREEPLNQDIAILLVGANVRADQAWGRDLVVVEQDQDLVLGVARGQVGRGGWAGIGMREAAQAVRRLQRAYHL